MAQAPPATTNSALTRPFNMSSPQNRAVSRSTLKIGGRPSFLNGSIVRFYGQVPPPTARNPEASQKLFQLVYRDPSTRQNRPQRSGSHVLTFVDRYDSYARQILAVGHGDVAAFGVYLAESGSGERPQQADAVDLRKAAQAASTCTASIEVRGSGIGRPSFTKASR